MLITNLPENIESTYFKIKPRRGDILVADKYCNL